MAIKILKCNFQLVTPCFLSDDSENCSNMIRPPAIKGALRFWWRALHWAPLLDKQEKKDNDKALQQLHREECELFGASGGDSCGGKSKIRLKLRCDNIKRYKFNHSKQHGLQYLAGLGLSSTDGFLRAAISPIYFSLHLIMDGLNNKQTRQLEQALLAFGLFGGLGSRSRKGYGSIALQSVDGQEFIQVPKNLTDYRQATDEFKISLDQLPPFTAFSNFSRIELLQRFGNDPLSVLNKLGEIMAIYRGYGYRKNDGNYYVMDQKAEQNFFDDKELIVSAINNGHLNNLPRRVVFGLPHNYGFTVYQGKGMELKPAMEKMDRRASPLFIHIHQFPSGEVCAVLLLMPAMFLPEKSKVSGRITVKGRNRPLTMEVCESSIDWQTIHSYMDRLKSEEISSE